MKTRPNLTELGRVEEARAVLEEAETLGQPSTETARLLDAARARVTDR